MSILPDPDFDWNTSKQPNPRDLRPGLDLFDSVSRPEAAQIAHLENQVRNQSRTISDLETKIRSLEKANKDATSDATTEIAKREQEIVHLKEENSTQKKQLQILQEDIKSTKLLGAGLTKQVGSLEQQMTGSISVMKVELAMGFGKVNQDIAGLRSEQQAEIDRGRLRDSQLRDSLAQTDLRFQQVIDSQNQHDPIWRQRYLVRATNNIDALLLQSKIVTSRDTMRYDEVATSTACDTLAKLATDLDFKTIVLEVAATKVEHQPVYRKHLQDMDQFRAFCEMDKEILLKSGLSANAVNQLLDLLKQLDGTAVGSLRHGIDPNEVFSAIDIVRDQTCGLVAQLESTAKKKKRSGILARVGYLLIGAVAVAANASNLVVQSGFDPSVGAVSQATGALVMQEAASGRLGLLNKFF